MAVVSAVYRRSYGTTGRMTVTPSSEQLRRCARCGEWKPHSEWYIYPKRAKPFSVYCRRCTCAHVSEWQKRNRDRASERQRAWREANPDRVKAYQLKAGRKWRALHPDEALAHVTRRRAAKLGAAAEPYSRREIYDRDGGVCRYCGKKVDFGAFHIAHLVALTLGGADAPSNVAVACAPCNQSDGVGRLAVQLHI